MAQHRLFHSIVVGSQLLLSGSLAGCFAEVVVQDPDPSNPPGGSPAEEPNETPLAQVDGGTGDAKADTRDAQMDPRACAPGWHPTKGTVCKVRPGRPPSEQVCCDGAPNNPGMCCVYQKPVAQPPPAATGKP